MRPAATGAIYTLALLLAARGAPLGAQGQITEYPVPTASSYPAAIIAAPDGNLWFVERTAKKVGKLTMDGAFREYPLPADSTMPTSIGVDQSGIVWFLEGGDYDKAGKIGKLSSDGNVTEYPLPTGTRPYDLSEDAKGNLWFTSGDLGSTVYKFTSSGALIAYPISPIPNQTDGKDFPPEPLSITLGPDGNMWFVELQANKIARITEDGAITEYVIHPVTFFRCPNSDPRLNILCSSSDDPDSIAAAPDGNLWFTESANRIGRITPTGRITYFPLPQGFESAMQMTAGRNGTLWFIATPSVNGASWSICMVGTTGKITAYPLPLGVQPNSLAVGPNGNVWFAATDNTIRKLIP